MELDGVELSAALRGKQVPLLLAYLVLSRDRVVGREELIGALWFDSAPRSQDAALRTLLSRLRSALGPSVLVGRDELVLELPAPAWVDVEAAGEEAGRALQALERGDARSAWALAQVPLNIASRGLMPGAQAPWLESRRRELADIRLQALEVVGRAGLGLGGTQLGSVERAARALIEAEPYRESGYVLLMQALQTQGNLAEAMRVFDRLRILLRDELGTAPSPAAIEAHDRLLHPEAPSRPSWVIDRRGVQTIPLAAELRERAAGPLVGRVEELARLEGWLSGAGGAHNGDDRGERVLLLSGDAGVGKTRLLAEVAKRAHAGGTLVLASRAPEETLVPFQPLLEALDQYVSAASEVELRAVAREHGAELSRLLPRLRRRLPDLPPADSANPDTERYRLFEAVAGLLGEISASMPVLIVLDDLHWADRPTLLLLRHLARAPKAARISVLGAYRATEHFSEAFDSALAGLRRDRLMTQMDVAGLPESDAAELVGLMLGGAPSDGFSHALYAETEGNPFFIEEIVRHLADSGVRSDSAGADDLQRFGLPDDVREVISRRLARLSEGTIEGLRVAAVIGRDFDPAMLENVLGLDEEVFLGALEEALAAGLVGELPGGSGRYAFSHALIRETLYEGMSATRRSRIHRRVGNALESAGPETNVSELAHHFTRGAARAQDAEVAIGYALRAGERATAMLAHEQAADHYASALELLVRFDPDAPQRQCDLLLELGEAQIRSGERPRAWTTFRQAATLAAKLGDGASLARAAIGSSRRYVQPPGVVDEELISLLEQALEMTAGEQSVRRVRLLTSLCGALYYSKRRHRMRQLSAEATVIAAELADPRAAALAAAARRRAYWGPGHLERRLADSTQLLRAARDAGDIELTLQGHAWLVVDLLESGDPAAVEAQIEAFTAGAQELRQPLFLWNAAVWRAMRSLLAGHLEQADALAVEALTSGMRPEGITAGQYYSIQLLAIRREQRRMQELDQTVRDVVAGSPTRPAWRAGLATLLCDTGHHDEAREHFELLAASGFTDIPEDGDWMITMVLAAEVAAELGDVERARLIYERLLPYRMVNVVIGLAAVCMGATARYLGRLAAVMGNREDAAVLLERAIARNGTLRAPVQLAHSQLDYASLLGGSARARELVQAAAQTAQELDLPLVAARAELLRR